MNTPAWQKKGAFTLVELMVVITIMISIGLFASLMVANAMDQARIHRTEATKNQIEIALDRFKQDTGAYPLSSSLDEFQFPVNKLLDPDDGWDQAGQEWFGENATTDENGEPTVLDAWSEPFYYLSNEQYESSGYGVELTLGKKDYYKSTTFQLYSKGPNMDTWPSELLDADNEPIGHPRLRGTEEDDIRNWQQDKFYTPADYNP